MVDSDAEILARFRAMRRRHIRASVALVAAVPGLLVLVGLASIVAPAAWGFFFLLYALFLLIGIAYRRATWSCPKCGEYLGEGMFLPGWDITHCRYCGVRLQ